MNDVIKTYEPPLLVLNLETNTPFLAYSMILKDGVFYYANYWYNDEASLSNSEIITLKQFKKYL